MRTLVRAPRSDAPLARDVMHDASIALSAHGITRGIVIALIRVVDGEKTSISQHARGDVCVTLCDKLEIVENTKRQRKQLLLLGWLVRT